jgi:hypothetical protein
MVFASPLLERVARPIRRSWQLNRHRLRFAVLLVLRARPPGHTIVSRSKRLNEGGASFGGR